MATACKGRPDYEELRAMEMAIIEGIPPPVPPQEEERLRAGDAKLGPALDALRCWGPALNCTVATPCPNCLAQRRYVTILLHREQYGTVPHPSDLVPKPAIGVLLSTVRPQRVSWLWPDRIPLGKLTILDGDPGLGKSVLTLDLAARVSRGLGMPDREPGEEGEPAGVVLLSAEDGLDDTVVPRLDAAGADRQRILALPTVTHEAGQHRLPTLPLDVMVIRQAVDQVRAKLVVIDPLMAYLDPYTNSHKDTDVRHALWPLAQLADNTGAAVLVVRHLNKGTASNPLYRGGGSIGIIGAARSALLVARDPDASDRRVLASSKCNLAQMPPSLGFALDHAQGGGLRIGWTGPSPHTAESLLSAKREDEDRNAIAEAADFLNSFLAGEAVEASVIKRQARLAGIADSTLRRAKGLVGVRSRKEGFGSEGKWYWYKEAQRDAHPGG